MSDVQRTSSGRVRAKNMTMRPATNGAQVMIERIGSSVMLSELPKTQTSNSQEDLSWELGLGSWQLISCPTYPQQQHHESHRHAVHVVLRAARLHRAQVVAR